MKKILKVIMVTAIIVVVGFSLIGCGLLPIDDILGAGDSQKLEFELSENGKYYIVIGLNPNYKDECIKITIPSTYSLKPVKVISDYAFNDNDKIENVIISDGVESIGKWAFANSSSLQKVSIPDSVTTIDEYAFSRNLKLREINIPNKIETISRGTFYYCPKLEKITIPESVVVIEAWAFGGCGLTSLSIPQNVSCIGEHAFEGVTRLSSVTIPQNVVMMKSGVFNAMPNTTIYCDFQSKPAGWADDWNGVCVVVWQGGNDVDDKTQGGGDGGTQSGDSKNDDISQNDGDAELLLFKEVSDGWCVDGLSDECDGTMTDITIPSLYQSKPVVSIGSYAFYKCSGLTSISIPSSVTSIGSYAFKYCSSLTSIKIPSSVTWMRIGHSAFENCSSLTAVYITDLAAWCNIEFGSYDANPLYYAHNLYLNDELVTELEIPSTVTEINDYAFYNCSGLTSIDIPSSVTSIGSDAFYNCSSLTSIVIPSGVTSIGSYAFCNCSSLTAVHITDVVAWCNIEFGSYYSNPLSYAHKLYLNGELVTEPEIPSTVTEIKKCAFSGCSSLTSIVIPSSVTSIGSSAFGDCSSLTAVHITDVAAWCNIEFGSSDANPLYYAHKLYLNGELVTELEIPSTVTEIKNYAFYDCSSLTSIEVPDNVTSIGEYAFWCCSSLTSVTFGENSQLESIGDEAFFYCSSLTSIEIPSTVTEIKNYAFYNCSSLTSIVIPASVTSIGECAFLCCSSLTIYCEAESQPSGWDSSWNSPRCPVVWGWKK